MYNSIKYFEEECINRFEKLEDDFMKEPQKLAEYVLKHQNGIKGSSTEGHVSHSVSLQNKKIVYFNTHIWGL